MKKFTILSLFCFILYSGIAQQNPMYGVSWVRWDNEPDYEGVVGYADNPYEKPTYVATQAADDWSYDAITDAATFDATWDILGDSMAVANPTNVDGGDLFNLGEATPTFGAAWKAVHDGTNLYILIKYWDPNGQADADSRSFEIMSQPTSIFRHEPTFQAAQDTSDDIFRVAYENQAYARFVELGGGKAVFKDGTVSDVQASLGLESSQYWVGYFASTFSANNKALESLALVNHFWDTDAEGTIRTIMVMPFDGALAYPEDPSNLDGNYISLSAGDTISFDVKSCATTTEGETTSKVEYFWSADKNNGYASNYYSGNLVIAGEGDLEPEGEQPMYGVSWVRWDNEPDYENVTGYAVNPYNTPKVTAKTAPASWSYDDITDAAGFDATWDILGDSMAVANPTNVDGGDLFDLGEATPTFGAAWKAVHDGTNLYVLIKYWDPNGQADADSRSFEIMSQPTSIFRHEPTFQAAQDTSDDIFRVAYENQAYARFVELGGGKAVFKDGTVSDVQASLGLESSQYWVGYFASTFSANNKALESLALVNHFWDTDAEGTIRTILVMPFDGALAYPEDPSNLDGNYISLSVGDTISFDVKSCATTTEGETTSKVEYFWSADKNNGYASNYYSGHLAISAEVVSVGTGIDHPMLSNNVKVYYHNNIINIDGLKNAKVDIYSISGALVKTAPNVNNTVNVSDLPKGIYFVKLNDIPQAFKIMKY